MRTVSFLGVILDEKILPLGGFFCRVEAMKVLILGGDGMLGHMLVRHLSPNCEVIFTTRKVTENSQHRLFAVSDSSKTKADLVELVRKETPHVIINCIGYIKQRDQSHCSEMVLLNSWFPHLLSDLSEEQNFKVLHFSTDCVFSGREGDYEIGSKPDPVDLYGVSKLAGEVGQKNCLTLRTSIIGHELKNKKSLIEWFFSQSNSCGGFRGAIYTGLTTLKISQLISDYFLDPLVKGELHGVWHLSSPKINKYELLQKVASTYKKDIEISPLDEPRIDRSLKSDEIFKKFNLPELTWDEMIVDMYKDFKANENVYSH